MHRDIHQPGRYLLSTDMRNIRRINTEGRREAGERRQAVKSGARFQVALAFQKPLSGRVSCGREEELAAEWTFFWRLRRKCLQRCRGYPEPGGWIPPQQAVAQAGVFIRRGLFLLDRCPGAGTCRA